MKRRPSPAALFLLVLAMVLPAQASRADEEADAYNAAAFLLAQTTRLSRDGRHNTLLLALRHLRDPQLAPLFEALSASPHPSLRIHGRLGLAEMSPARRLDLNTVAEIEDPAELSQLLGAALDHGLITTADLDQVMQWEGLDASVQQAIAVRVVAGGGMVDDSVLRRSLLLEDAPATVATLLRHGLAALMLMERGDLTGIDELRKLSILGQPADRDVIRAQMFEAAMRHGFATIGPWALEIAEDPSESPALRVTALRTALRFPPTGQALAAVRVWESMFEAEQDAVQRVRLALTALEGSPWADPSLYRLLEADTDDQFGQMGAAGRAIAAGDPAATGLLIQLIGQGHPLAIRWAGRYANEHAGSADRAAVLDAIVRGALEGPARTRARRTELAIAAAQGLAEADTPESRGQLLPMLEPAPAQTRRGELGLHHIALLGLVRAEGQGPAAIARAVPDQHDADATDLALLIRARWDAPMDADQWSRISRIVAGASSLDDSLRAQFAWLYLKHIGRAGEAVRAAIEPNR